MGALCLFEKLNVSSIRIIGQFECVIVQAYI
jgi:hypothetical protein